MAWSYDNLWILLIKKKINKSDLTHIAHLTTNTIARMGDKEEISMKSIGRICNALDCKVQDVIEWIPENKEEN